LTPDGGHDTPLAKSASWESDHRVRVAAHLLLASLALGTLAGCSTIRNATEYKPQVRGNRVDLDALKELTAGTSTKADATALLGSPTAKATFDDNKWIYISEVTQPRVARKEAVLSQEVVVLTFDQGGVLRDVESLNQDDSLSVAMASGATPSPGSEASFLQQLFGNVGKYNPGGAQTGEQGPNNTIGNLNTR
jgi:outer membrane protein assembly factor BamE (lipoprotein component of BamABCDE complex)